MTASMMARIHPPARRRRRRREERHVVRREEAVLEVGEGDHADEAEDEDEGDGEDGRADEALLTASELCAAQSRCWKPVCIRLADVTAMIRTIAIVQPALGGCTDPPAPTT